MVETTQAMIAAWDASHVGVRLSPSSYLYGVDDSNKLETFGTVIERLNALGVAYLRLLEPNTKDAERGVQIEHVAATFRTRVTVPLIVNTGFDKKKGNAILAGGMADAVAFGVPYIANPDLGTRLRSGFATVDGVQLHYGSQHLLAPEGESRCVQPARVRMAIGSPVF